MEPTTPTPEDAAAARRRNIMIGVIAAVVVVIAVIVAVVLLADDDDDEDVTTGTSTTTSVSTTSTTTSTSSSSSTTATTSTPTTGPGISDEEAATVVWPDPEGPVAYDEPLAAAQGFAEDLVGFTDPVIGEFQQGDNRSGEFEIQAQADGPVTTVGVRQMSDDRWYVIFATTEDIVVDDPVAGTAIDDPLLVSGQARAFEGTVQVAVYERGGTEPLGEGFVTGSGGGELGPFSGEIRWDNPVGGWGLVLFTTLSAEDGSVWQAVAIPVGFIGGD